MRWWHEHAIVSVVRVLPACSAAHTWLPFCPVVYLAPTPLVVAEEAREERERGRGGEWREGWERVGRMGERDRKEMRWMRRREGERRRRMGEGNGRE